MAETCNTYIAADSQQVPVAHWKGADGNTYIPGSVTPDGDIVGPPGTFVRAGVVWVLAETVAEAIRHGWERAGAEGQNGKLVAVKRA